MKPLFVTRPLSCFFAPSRFGTRLRFGARLLFASRLRQPKRFRLICFRPPPTDRGPAWLTLRLCGLPGDSIEIKNGTLYVNRADADKDLQLTHVFKVSRSDSSAIRHDPRHAWTIPSYPDIVYLTLPDEYVRKHQLPCEQYRLPPGLRSDSIYKAYRKNWNEDNFGPITVPRGSWFVLGDDRGHSIDSRHFGFIDRSAYIGTLL